jgi:hypothetical protein
MLAVHFVQEPLCQGTYPRGAEMRDGMLLLVGMGALIARPYRVAWWAAGGGKSAGKVGCWKLMVQRNFKRCWQEKYVEVEI